MWAKGMQQKKAEKVLLTSSASVQLLLGSTCSLQEADPVRTRFRTTVSSIPGLGPTLTVFSIRRYDCMCVHLWDHEGSTRGMRELFLFQCIRHRYSAVRTLTMTPSEACRSLLPISDHDIGLTLVFDKKSVQVKQQHDTWTSFALSII